MAFIHIGADISNFSIFVTGQNLTDEVYLESRGELSLGRIVVNRDLLSFLK